MRCALLFTIVLQSFFYSSASSGTAFQTDVTFEKGHEQSPYLIDVIFDSVFIKDDISQSEYAVASTLLQLHLSLFKLTDVKCYSSVYNYYLKHAAHINIGYDSINYSKLTLKALIAYEIVHKEPYESFVLYGTTKNHQVFCLKAPSHNPISANDCEFTVRSSWSELLDTMDQDKLKQLASSLSKTPLLKRWFQDNTKEILRCKLIHLLPFLTKAQINFQRAPLTILVRTGLLKTLQLLCNGCFFCFCGPHQQYSRLRAR